MTRTNINLNEKLVKEGMRRFKCRSKRELVDLALQALVQRERRKDILAWAGKIHWKGDLKAWRQDHP